MDVLTHVFLEFREEPAQLNAVITAIAEVVQGSFFADGSTPTRSEVQRRTGICAKWLLELRKDLGWAAQRALDELPKALRCELDGVPYTPTRMDRNTWSADNGRDLVWLPE